MQKIIVSILLYTLIWACSSSGDNQTNTTSASVAKVDGEKIYKTYCVTCHGVYGDMGSSGAFDLTTSKLSLEERIAVITEGRNTMTPFKTLLNEEKIEAVARYIEKLRK